MLDTAPGPQRRTAQIPHLAQVVRAHELSPALRRVVVTGEGLEAFATAEPAAKVTIYLPGADGVPTTALRRSWTARRYRPEAGELDLDFVQHDGGAASAWAAAARPGEQLGWAGPAPGYVPLEDADGHLLVADATALPAVGSILEALPAGAPARALLAVAGPQDELDLATGAALETTWLHVTPGSPALADAVRGLDRLPGERPQAFVAGEAGVVREVLLHLREERGVPPDRLHAKGYWREGRSKAAPA